MKRQNITAIFLFTAMHAASLAACGDSAGETKTTDAMTANTASFTDQAEYVAPKVDYGGETIPFYVCHYNGAYKLCKYDAISPDDEMEGDIINDAIFKRNAEVENLLNVKITSTNNTNGNADGATPLIKSILAGDDSYDAALIWQRQCSALLGSEGYLYDLTDVGTLDLEASWVNQNVNDIMNINGSQFLMLGDICMWSMISGPCLFFSKTMVEQYDLDDPYQLVYDGKWTLDNFVKMAKQVSIDLNGDGEMSIEDAFGMNGSATVIELCIRSAGIQKTGIDKDGNAKMLINNEKTIHIVDVLSDLLGDTHVNMIPQNFEKYIKNADVWYDVILPMFKNNQLLFTFNWVFYALELRDMTTDFGLVPMPKYDETQKNHYTYVSDNFAECLVVPATVKDADMVGNVLNAMGYYSQQYVYPEVVERTVDTKTMRDESSADMLDIIYDNILFDMNDFYIWDNRQIMDIWYGCVNSRSNQFASKYAAIEKSTLEKMNQTLEYLEALD